MHIIKLSGTRLHLWSNVKFPCYFSAVGNSVQSGPDSPGYNSNSSIPTVAFSCPSCSASDEKGLKICRGSVNSTSFDKLRDNLPLTEIIYHDPVPTRSESTPYLRVS